MYHSSTPDGLAPLTNTAMLIFICIFLGIPLLWGIANLVLLIRRSPAQSNEQSQRVAEVARKTLRGSFDIIKFECSLSLIATIIFFLVIMGGVQHFKQFNLSIAYLLGSINAIIICGASAVTSNMALGRVISFARFSMYDAFDVARRAANFQVFFFPIWTLFGLLLYIILYARQNELALIKPEQIQKMTNTMISFTFGCATVALTCRITNSIYSKGSEVAIDNLPKTENRLQRSHKHPALLIKSLGETFNKVISNILDSTTYILLVLSLSMRLAGGSVIGTDQEGEIIFQLNFRNCCLGIIVLCFQMFFIVGFNVLAGVGLRPSSGEEVRRHFNVQKYFVFGFLCGFLALAAYLGLPAEFILKEETQSDEKFWVRHPYFAYLCLLFGMFLSLLLSLSSEISTTHPLFVSIISNSCSTGSATNIIYGLSFGYLWNFLPIILKAGLLFLSNFWLGPFGVCLLSCGYLTLLPVSMASNITLSYLDNCSYISYVSSQDEGVIVTLIQSADCRKDVEPEMLSYHYGILGFISFTICEAFLMEFGEGEKDIIITSLKSPSIFLGLLVGAMYPYITSSALIRSVHKCYLAIAYNLTLQIEEIPSMANGSIDPDFVQCNNFYTLQCILSFKRFFFIIFGPMIIIGIALGPEAMLGFLAGSFISVLQLGLSSVMSGCVWNNTKKEIGAGRIHDENDNVVKGDSEWGRAAEVGSQIGMTLKDCVGTTVHMMCVFTGIMSLVLARMYGSIHGIK